jgi:hypothetical protein
MPFLPSARTLWIAALVVTLAVLVGRRYEPGHGLTALTQFDVTFQPRQVPALAAIPHHVRSPTGFDGQFYCQLALDPLLLDPHTRAAIDTPVFRGRRILIPWLTYLLGAGRPYWIVHLYPLVNIAFWLLLLVLLVRRVPSATRFDRAAITAILFSTGILESVRLALLDLPVSYFAVLPCLLGATGAGGVAALACACLSRETGVLAIASFFGLRRPVDRPLWHRAALAIAAVVPLFLWYLYIGYRWGGAFDPRSPLSSPIVHMLHALWWNLSRVVAELSPGAMASVAIIVGLCTQAGFLWRHRRMEDPLWRLGAIFTVLLLFLGPDMWALPSATCRYMIPLTIAFNLQLVRTPELPRRWTWFSLGNAYSVFGVIKFLTYTS